MSTPKLSRVVSKCVIPGRCNPSTGETSLVVSVTVTRERDDRLYIQTFLDRHIVEG